MRGLSDGVFEVTDATEREHWFDESVRAQAELVRASVIWRAIAPQRPANPTDPADPAYQWPAALDAMVRSAAAREQTVLLTVYSAPYWATGEDGPEDERARGRWKPDPDALGDFATALARRYSGDFVVGGERLPAVRHFQAWAEPNLGILLGPQFDGKKLVGADHYRQMLSAFFDGAKRGNPRAKIVTGGTGPFGNLQDSPLSSRPLAFWRRVLCLKGSKKLKPIKNCQGRAKLHFLAHHPFNASRGPQYHARHRDDITVPDVKKLRRVVRVAKKLGTATVKGRADVWATEMWWESNPPEKRWWGVPLKKHARYVAESMYLLWKQKTPVYIWQSFVDPVEEGGDTGGFDTGLLFNDGSEKPAFQAFRFPFVADRKNKRKVKVWAVAPAAGKLRIQQKKRSGWKNRGRVRVKDGVPASIKVRARGKTKLRGVIEGERSLPYGAK